MQKRLVCSRSIVALCFVSLLVAACPGCSQKSKSKRYVGRTVLYCSDLSFLGPNADVDDAYRVATSQTCLERSAEALCKLKLESPEYLLRHTYVQPFPDDRLMVIEVTLESPRDAKIVADVFASEFKKSCKELQMAEIRARITALESAAESLNKEVRDTTVRWREFKEKNGVQASLAEADMDAAAESYKAVAKQLADARVEEKCLEASSPIKTIDYAYVMDEKRYKKMERESR